MEYTQLITVEPGKRGGQPCIRGMRITVRDVLEYVAGGMTVPELLADFPKLTVDDVRACMAFAANHLSWTDDTNQDGSPNFDTGLPSVVAEVRLRVRCRDMGYGMCRDMGGAWSG